MEMIGGGIVSRNKTFVYGRSLVRLLNVSVRAALGVMVKNSLFYTSYIPSHVALRKR